MKNISFSKSQIIKFTATEHSKFGSACIEVIKFIKDNDLQYCLLDFFGYEIKIQSDSNVVELTFNFCEWKINNDKQTYITDKGMVIEFNKGL